MSAAGPQFSLKALFVGMTLIAGLLAIAVSFPPVAISAIVVTSPLLFVAGMAFIASRVPALAHAVLLVTVCVAFFVVTFFVLIGLVDGG